MAEGLEHWSLAKGHSGQLALRWKVKVSYGVRLAMGQTSRSYLLSRNKFRFGSGPRHNGTN